MAIGNTKNLKNSSKAENAGIKIPNNIIVVPERDSPNELCRVEDMANSVKKGFPSRLTYCRLTEI